MPVSTSRDPGPVHLLGQDGRRYDFSSLLALSHWLASRISRRRGAYRHWDLSIGPAFRVRVDRDWLGQPYYREYDFILRDAQGNSLDPGLIPAPAWAEKWKRGQRGPVPAWRRGPVPRTGCGCLPLIFAPFLLPAFDIYHAAVMRCAWHDLFDGDTRVQAFATQETPATASVVRPAHFGHGPEFTLKTRGNSSP